MLPFILDSAFTTWKEKRRVSFCDLYFVSPKITKDYFHNVQYSSLFTTVFRPLVKGHMGKRTGPTGGGTHGSR